MAELVFVTIFNTPMCRILRHKFQ